METEDKTSEFIEKLSQVYRVMDWEKERQEKEKLRKEKNRLYKRQAYWREKKGADMSLENHAQAEQKLSHAATHKNDGIGTQGSDGVSIGADTPDTTDTEKNFHADKKLSQNTQERKSPSTKKTFTKKLSHLEKLSQGRGEVKGHKAGRPSLEEQEIKYVLERLAEAQRETAETAETLALDNLYVIPSRVLILLATGVRISTLPLLEPIIAENATPVIVMAYDLIMRAVNGDTKAQKMFYDIILKGKQAKAKTGNNRGRTLDLDELLAESIDTEL